MPNTISWLIENNWRSFAATARPACWIRRKDKGVNFKGKQRQVLDNDERHHRVKPSVLRYFFQVISTIINTVFKVFLDNDIKSIETDNCTKTLKINIHLLLEYTAVFIYFKFKFQFSLTYLFHLITKISMNKW